MRIEQKIIVNANQVNVNNKKIANPSDKNKSTSNFNDRYEKMNNENPLTVYKNINNNLSSVQIQELQNQTEKAHSALKELVTRLIKDQGNLYNQSVDMIEISSEVRAEAQSLISNDGKMGIEAVSDRIVDFAIAVSGGDKSKLDQMKGYISQGFQEAENTFGTLPEISHKTFDAVMSKLDQWASL